MMLWKCCIQYVSKFGKLSSGHRIGKGQFSFQSQRMAMPKNIWTPAQLLSSHNIAKWCSKFSKWSFSSTWTKNFEMFKLDLEKAKEPEIKLPTSIGSSKKQEFQQNIYFCFIDHTKVFVWITTNCGKFLEMGISDHLTCFLRNLYAGQEAIVKAKHGTKDWFQIGKGVHQGCILSPCLFNLYAGNLSYCKYSDQVLWFKCIIFYFLTIIHL